MRSIAAVFLAALALVLSVPASVSAWQERAIYDEDEFVATMDEALDKEEVRTALASRLTDTIVERAEIRERIGTLLQRLEEEGPEGIPQGVALLEGPLTTVARDAIYRAVLTALEAQPLQDVRDAALRATHRAVTALIDDDVRFLAREGNTVVLDLRPILEEAIKEIGGERGEEFLQRVNLPEDAGQIVLFERSDSQTRATRLLFWWLQKAWPVVPIAVVSLFAAAVLIAQSRRRTIITIGAALAALTAVTVLAVSLAGQIAADALAQKPEGEEAIKATYNVVVDSFKRQQMFVVLIGVAMAGGGWVAGESALMRAVRSRMGAGPGERFDFRGWVGDHLFGLRAAGMVGGALLFITWPDPGVRFTLTVFALVALYLLLLALIVSESQWAVKARAYAAEFNDRYLRTPPSVESGGLPANWVARRAAAIRIALITLGVAFLILLPDVRFSTVAVVVVVELLLFAGVDALASRTNNESGGPRDHHG